MNVLPLSLIVAAFWWHTPPLQVEQIESQPLDTQTIALVYDQRIVLRYDWPNWPKQLTCTILVRAAGAIEHRTTPVKYGVHAWRVTPSCGYVFGGVRTVRPPRFVTPHLYPQ